MANEVLQYTAFAVIAVDFCNQLLSFSLNFSLLFLVFLLSSVLFGSPRGTATGRHVVHIAYRAPCHVISQSADMYYLYIT